MVQLVTIDKIAAAGCQIDTAIELIFRNRDCVSQCVLVHSAWSVVKDLLKDRKIESSRDWMPELFGEKNKKNLWDKLDFAWNFLKHAKDDPNHTLQMDAQYPETAVFLVIHDFGQLGPQSELMDLYQFWFIAKHKDLFDVPDSREIYLEAVQVFPDLYKKTHFEQAKCGLDVVKDLL